MLSFFFFKQKTAYEMRISDWSSDVCSSDLIAAGGDSGILWTSHNMYEVEAVCDRVLFVSHGRVLLQGDPRRLPAEHGVASLEELFISVAREPLAFEARAPT